MGFRAWALTSDGWAAVLALTPGEGKLQSCSGLGFPLCSIRVLVSASEGCCQYMQAMRKGPASRETLVRDSQYYHHWYIRAGFRLWVLE